MLLLIQYRALYFVIIFFTVLSTLSITLSTIYYRIYSNSIQSLSDTSCNYYSHDENEIPANTGCHCSWLYDCFKKIAVMRFTFPPHRVSDRIIEHSILNIIHNFVSQTLIRSNRDIVSLRWCERKQYWMKNSC